jgi:hypothetical protein
MCLAREVGGVVRGRACGVLFYKEVKEIVTHVLVKAPSCYMSQKGSSNQTVEQHSACKRPWICCQ